VLSSDAKAKEIGFEFAVVSARPARTHAASTRLHLKHSPGERRTEETQIPSLFGFKVLSSKRGNDRPTRDARLARTWRIDASQFGGILINDRSSSAVEAQPSSLRVRMRSVQRISIARATP